MVNKFGMTRNCVWLFVQLFLVFDLDDADGRLDCSKKSFHRFSRAFFQTQKNTIFFCLHYRPRVGCLQTIQTYWRNFPPPLLVAQKTLHKAIWNFWHVGYLESHHLPSLPHSSSSNYGNMPLTTENLWEKLCLCEKRNMLSPAKVSRLFTLWRTNISRLWWINISPLVSSSQRLRGDHSWNIHWDTEYRTWNINIEDRIMNSCGKIPNRFYRIFGRWHLGGKTNLGHHVFILILHWSWMFSGVACVGHASFNENVKNQKEQKSCWVLTRVWTSRNVRVLKGFNSSLNKYVCLIVSEIF